MQALKKQNKDTKEVMFYWVKKQSVSYPPSN